MKRRCQQILVVSLSNIGDVILTTPVIMNLRRQFPEARMTVVAGPKAEGLLRGSSSIDRLVLYNKKAGPGKQCRFLFSLWPGPYALVIDLRNTAIPFLVPARRRSPLWRTYRHTGMRRRHLEVLEMAGVPMEEQPAVFDFFSENEKRSADEKLRASGLRGGKYAVVAAGAASEQKRWPLEYYSQWIRSFCEHTGLPVILSGDGNEAGYVEPLCRSVPGKVINLAGKMSLRESAAMIAGCEVLISNDSAAMHLGHELSCRVVAVFGPTDPERYGRRGARFRLLISDRAAGDGVDWVRPEAVWRETQELLKTGNGVHSC